MNIKELIKLLEQCDDEYIDVYTVDSDNNVSAITGIDDRSGLYLYLKTEIKCALE
jgi:hypothetical protein